MRCEQCGEREASVSLFSVTDGSLKNERLCRACVDRRAGPAPTAEDRARMAAETFVELEALAAELLAAPDGGDDDDDERMRNLERRYRALAPDGSDPPNARAYRARPRPPRVRVAHVARPTLWRGGQLLGVIHHDHERIDASLSGVLIPADPRLPLANIDQKRARRPHGLAVVQTETTYDSHPWPDARRLEEGVEEPAVPLEVLEHVEVPPERELQVRDDDGQPLPVSTVWLVETRLVAGVTDHLRDRFPAAVHRTPVPGAADRERIWFVIVRLIGDRHVD